MKGEKEKKTIWQTIKENISVILIILNLFVGAAVFGYQLLSAPQRQAIRDNFTKTEALASELVKHEESNSSSLSTINEKMGTLVTKNELNLVITRLDKISNRLDEIIRLFVQKE